MAFQKAVSVEKVGKGQVAIVSESKKVLKEGG